MILKALCDYYDAMLATGSNIPRMGMEYKAVKFRLVITTEGEFVRLEDISGSDKNGQQLSLIQGEKRTVKVFPYTLWDKSKYVFGWDVQDKKGPSFPEHLQVFIDRIDLLCEQYPNNIEFKAVQSFYAKYREHLSELEDIENVKSNDWITFHVENSPYFHISAHPDALDWAEKTLNIGNQEGCCIVYGKRLPLANLHPSVNLAGAEAQATIVSFQKNQGFDSYGKQQGENAPISTKASFAHTSALNYLLRKGATTNYRIGDITYVFWNSLLDDEINEAFIDFTFADDTPSKKDGNNPEEKAHRVQETFKGVLGLKNGSTTRKREGDEGDFYILGISPGGRIAVRLWKVGTISEIFNNLWQHLNDMNIVDWENKGDEQQPPKRPLYKMIRQVASTDKSDKWGLNLIQSIVESILNNTPYPKSLQEACLGRVRLQGEVNETRASILKGCVNRDIRTKKYIKSKELTMALDRTNTNTAYLLGRAFAILEKIQYFALGKTNATIRDRFYGSASTRPNTVFGRLISLSNHHLSKLRKDKPGLAHYFEKELEEILSKIDTPNGKPPFPGTFNLDEQSLFAVGYYQQKAYRKPEDGEKEEDSEE